MSIKKCVVTGAAGFIGSHLSEELIRQGHIVYGIDNLSKGVSYNVYHLDKNKFFFIHKNILNYQQSFRDIDWFFHLAARADVVPSIEEPELYHETNVMGTVKMLELARRCNAKKFIYAASSSCYGDDPVTPTKEQCQINPKYPYALTKFLGEECVKHWGQVYGLKTTSLRLFNVFGPKARSSSSYGAVFGIFLSQLANEKPFTVVGDGEQKRDFTYVTDVAKAFVLAAESDETGVFNVGSGCAQSVNYLTILLDSKKEIDFIPDRPGEPRITQADNSKIRFTLGWKPQVSFEDGVAIMLKQAHLFKDAPLWDRESIAMATKSWFHYLS